MNTAIVTGAQHTSRSAARSGGNRLYCRRSAWSRVVRAGQAAGVHGRRKRRYRGYAKDYGPKAKQSIVSHGGVYVAAGKGTLIDGHVSTGRVVILRWESMDQLNAWRYSPEYENIRKIGEKYAKYNIVTVEGVPQK